MANDWNDIRYQLDDSEHFDAICNSPWYTDAVYDKFSAREYERRYAVARAIMARDGYDAIVFTGSPNIYSHGAGVTWASGLFDLRGMCQYLVLPRAGEPTLVYPHPGCHIEAARRMVSIKDVRGGEHGHYGKVVADRLIELGLRNGRIAIAAADRTGPEFMGMNAYNELRRYLPQAMFMFLPLLLHELAHRKSPEELRAMEKAGALAIKALEAIAAAARPGVRDYQLEAAATYAVMNGGGRVHLLMLASTSMNDPRLIFPNPNPSARVLAEGDIILCELAMSYLGYSAKIGHPVSVGPPTKRYRDFFRNVLVGGFRAIRDTLKPGTTLEAVREVAARAFRDRGAQSRPICMHGLDLITSVPFISVDEVKGQNYDMVMQPGATYSIEITPVNLDGTFGMFFARSFAITETGRMELTPYPIDDIIVAGGAKRVPPPATAVRQPPAEKLAAKASTAKKPAGPKPAGKKPAAAKPPKKRHP
ncbi:MAG: aminopeptidase P family protein [Betaproteobacteria bacterium]|nr:aminopeptidase P family protein [Betaproteobacteria bacterium]